MYEIIRELAKNYTEETALNDTDCLDYLVPINQILVSLNLSSKIYLLIRCLEFTD